MNAYELAKLLAVDSWYKLITREEIANMLRQQADEIKVLHQILEYGGVGKEYLDECVAELRKENK